MRVRTITLLLLGILTLTLLFFLFVNVKPDSLMDLIGIDGRKLELQKEQGRVLGTLNASGNNLIYLIGDENVNISIISIRDDGIPFDLTNYIEYTTENVGSKLKWAVNMSLPSSGAAANNLNRVQHIRFFINSSKKLETTQTGYRYLNSQKVSNGIIEKEYTEFDYSDILNVLQYSINSSVEPTTIPVPMTITTYEGVIRNESNDIIGPTYSAVVDFDITNRELLPGENIYLDPEIFIDNVQTYIPVTKNNITTDAFPSAHVSTANSSLNLYLPFLENNSIQYDFSDDGNNVTLSGTGFVNSSGVYGDAYQGDGINSYLVSGSTTLGINANNFTLTGWIRKPTENTKQKIMDFRSGGIGFFVHIQDSAETQQGALRLFIDDGTGQVNIYGTTRIDDGNWHHFVIVANRTQEAVIYVDGVVDTTGSIVAADGDLGTRDLNIGSSIPARVQFFNGSLDDLMIFNRVLTSTELTAIYNNQSNRFSRPASIDFENLNFPPGDNRVNITLNTSIEDGTSIQVRLRQLRDSNNTINSSWQNITTGDNNLTIFEINPNINNLTLEVNFTNDVNNFHTAILKDSIDVVTWRMATEDIDTVERYTPQTKVNITTDAFPSAHVSTVDPDLRIYYPFKEGGIIQYDYTEYGNNATANLTSFVNSTGVYGDALQLDGTNNPMASQKNLDITGVQNRTLMAWFNIKTDISGGSQIITHGNDGNFQAFNLLARSNSEVTNPNQVQIACFSCNRIWNFNFDVNEWHHVAVVLNGTKSSDLIAYGDGSVLTVSSTNDQVLNTVNTPLYIGNRFGNDAPFNGSIDEVMVFNRSLSAAEISAIFSNQSERFSRPASVDYGNINFTAGSNRVNVTVNTTIDFGTSIQIRLREFQDSTPTTNTSWQNITSGKNNLTVYEIGSTTNNITVEVNFTNDVNNFHTAVLEDGIGIKTWSLGDNDPPAVSNVIFYAENSTNDIMGNETFFNSGNLSEIEYMRINFTVSEGTEAIIDGDITLWLTAGGNNGCTLGNNQSNQCYNFSNPHPNKWIKFQNGTNTSTFKDEGASGDFISCDFTGNPSRHRNYSCLIDEHYNPNVFKYYIADYNFGDVKWQDAVNQRITGNKMIKVHINQTNVPTNADQYKVDFRANFTGTPDALTAYICNSTYTVGLPSTTPGCALVASVETTDFQDDGTKFRGVFTNSTIDQIGDFGFVILDTEETSGANYYYIKTYAIRNPTWTQRWEFTTNNGNSWANLADGYESELNINWFYDGPTPTKTMIMIEAVDNSSQVNRGNSSTFNMSWDIDPTNNYPLITDIIIPSNNEQVSATIDINWSVIEPNDDDWLVNVTWSNSTNTTILLNDSYFYINRTTFNTSLWANGWYNLTVTAWENDTGQTFTDTDRHDVEIGNFPPPFFACGTSINTTSILNNDVFGRLCYAQYVNRPFGILGEVLRFT
jgi:hypothetical protein